MVPFDESSVFIPASTLEDFPADASDSDARSLLGGWTVLWDPRLLAQSEQLPTWYRADSPPEPDGPRIVVVPDSSYSQLPSGFEAKCKRNEDCLWVTGSDRQEMLQQLQLGDTPPALKTEHRTIGVEDFYAAGYCSLQIQIMTRRLRYTSNLDEIHLQKELVAAAKAFIAGDAKTAVSSLHNVFDSLSEERDHYFSSDPHLIDLTLLTPGTIESLTQSDILNSVFDDREHTARLQTPQNVLISADVAKALCGSPNNSTDNGSSRLCQQLRDGNVGWSGGAPASDTCLDAMTHGEAEKTMQAAWQLAKDAIGVAPTVYGQFAGATPSDMIGKLVSLGYVGMIPIDFANGTGHGDEAKVIQKSGGTEIESLTAKPMDASSDAAFLSLGARLGEAIDSGEIATGLFAHWPNQACDSFRDLRCVASWCLALGKFWKLDEYFREGEHPYHHGSAKAITSDAADRLTRMVADQVANPVAAVAETICDHVRSEVTDRLSALTAMVAGKPQSEIAESSLDQFASAVGAKPSPAQTAAVIVNASAVGRRVKVTIDGPVSDSPDHVYAVDTAESQSTEKQSTVFVDVPAYGFATVQKDSQGSATKGSLMERLVGKKPMFGAKKIAEGNLLKNEFMEVVINEETGGIQGVYSGSVRGNRFSMRLILASPNDAKSGSDRSITKCKQLSVVENSASMAVVETVGTIHDESEKIVAEFKLRYELERGSRFLKVSGELDCKADLGDDPWKSYIAARGVVASEAAIVRVMVRDKMHRARSRRIFSPLGVVIDEAERQTLVATYGSPYQRRVGDRFLDSVLAVKGQSKANISLCYGFDVSNPMANAKALVSPAEVISVEPAANLPPQGWIAHVTPAEVSIAEIKVARRADGLLAAIVRVMQTRNKSASSSIRFCRDVAFACNLDSRDDSAFETAIPSKEESDADVANLSAVKWKGDAVRFTLAGHQVFDFLVVFQSQASTV